MKRILTFVVVCLFSAALAVAQDQASPGTSSPNTSGNSGNASQDQSGQQSADQSQKKDKKKKKKDKGGADDVNVPTSFSDAVAQSVLQQLQDGLEGHSDRTMLSAFDDNKMDGYLNFEDQILAMFQKYDGFRVHFRISQATMEGDKGVALVDMDMEEMPRSAGQPVRKHDQIRFEMERGKKGWKIVDIRPRQFFS
jgi:flagellum-specific peptidoglycan hydrolase FlgJ